MLGTAVRFVAKLYQWCISPVLHAIAGPGMGCRYHPTCSEYFEQAVRVHGSWHGSMLGARRLMRCHPWARGMRSDGFDPVPRANSKAPLKDY